jgi:hypothetical protein
MASKRQIYIETAIKNDIRSAKAKLTRDKNRGIATGSSLYDDIRAGIKNAEQALKSGEYTKITAAREKLFRANQEKFVAGSEGSPVRMSTLKALNVQQAQLNRRNRMYDQQFDQVERIAGGIKTGATVKEQNSLFKETSYKIGERVLISEKKTQEMLNMLQGMNKDFGWRKYKQALNMQANALLSAMEINDEKLAEKIKKMSIKQVMKLSKTTDFFERIFTDYKSFGSDIDAYESDTMDVGDDIPF